MAHIAPNSAGAEEPQRCSLAEKAWDNLPAQAPHQDYFVGAVAGDLQEMCPGLFWLRGRLAWEGCVHAIKLSVPSDH